MLKRGTMHLSSYHTGRRLQRGRGIGSLFGTVFRSLLPLGKKILTSNTAKSIAKSVGNSLKDAAVDTALDALEGKNIKKAAQERLNQSKVKISQALRKQTDNKKIRNRKSIKAKSLNKRNYSLLN